MNLSVKNENECCQDTKQPLIYFYIYITKFKKFHAALYIIVFLSASEFQSERKLTTITCANLVYTRQIYSKIKSSHVEFYRCANNLNCCSVYTHKTT